MEPHHPQPDKRSSALAETLFAEFLARRARGGDPNFEELCVAHPEESEELRRRHLAWQRAGRALLGLRTSSKHDSVLEAINPTAPAPSTEDLATPPRRKTSDSPAPPRNADVFWHRYSIQEEIGRGGMGSILSVVDEDFGRQLAMKVLRSKGGLFAGVDDAPTPKDEKARFFEEARITGKLQHPNIVPVHELGLDPDGKPFFTMKLVEGRTFREILKLARNEEDGWNIHRAIGVLLQVCEAVGFAHDKGVIHRDLKPANLMVGSFGEVYVMDWGLARDLTRPERTQPEGELPLDFETQEFRTRDGDVIGTPEYMSPEQATGRREDIGPLSDVFAVGAMLYELLTGQAPHGVRGSKSPFVRLAAAIGAQHVEVRKLAPQTPAELCAICERAIANDVADRYGSMIELAQDLRAYLEGRVVRAYATGAWAELRKWVQRNPWVASLAGALVTLVVVGFIVISGLALRITKQKSDLEARGQDLAAANSNLQQKTAEAEGNLALARRREVDANEALALAKQRELEAIGAREEAQQRALELETVTEFQASMLRDIDAETMGLGMLARQRGQIEASFTSNGVSTEEVQSRLHTFDQLVQAINPTDLALSVIDENILSSALGTIDVEFKDQPLVEAKLRETTGETYLELGLYPLALPQLIRSLELRRRELGDEHERTLVSINLVATAYERLGQLAEAEAFYVEALEGSCHLFGPANRKSLGFLNNLAILHKSMNRFEEAEALYREALRGRRERLGNDHPDTLGTIGNLGALLAATGELGEAEALHREALDGNRRVLGEDDVRTLSSFNNMGHLLKNMNRFAEAYPYYEAALLGRRRILGDVHPDTLTSVNNFGLMLKLLKDYEGAEVYYHEALEGRRRMLGNDHPDTFVSVNNMGSFLKALGRLEEAEPYYREALEGNRRKLGDTHQQTLVFKNNLGALLRDMDRLEEARELIAEALQGALAGQGSDHPLTLHFMWNLGSLKRDLGELPGAEDLLRQGLERLLRVSPRNERLEEAFLKDLGRVLVARENWTEAEVILLQRHTLAKKKANTDPSEAFRIQESIRALVKFYESWEAAQPAEARRVQLEAWRSQLAEVVPGAEAKGE